MRSAMLMLTLAAFLAVPFVSATSTSQATHDLPLPVPGDPSPKAPNAVRAVLDATLRSDFSGFDVDLAVEIFEFEFLAGEGMPAASIHDLPEPGKAMFEAAVEARVQDEMDKAFRDTHVRLQELVFTYSPLNVDSDPYNPPVYVDVKARVDFTAKFLGGFQSLGTASPSDLAESFLYSGGKYLMTQNVAVAPGYDITINMHMPAPVELRKCDACQATRSLSFASNNLERSSKAALPLFFIVALEPEAVPANVLAGPLVRVDLEVEDHTSKVKQIVPFASGDFAGHLELYIEVHSLESRFFVDYPMPDAVRLPQISADLLRVAFAAEVVKEDDVQAFFERLITRSLQNAFGNETVVKYDRQDFARSVALPIGGADGKTVEPLIIHARSAVPLEVKDKMVGSNMARGLGMVLPASNSFDLSNNGIWDVEYTILYPDTLQVVARDDLGKVENFQVDGRHGIRIVLEKGEATRVHVSGKADFEPVVFFSQAGEGLLAIAGLGLVSRRVRQEVQIRRGRRANLTESRA